MTHGWRPPGEYGVDGLRALDHFARSVTEISEPRRPLHYGVIVVPNYLDPHFERRARVGAAVHGLSHPRGNAAKLPARPPVVGKPVDGLPGIKETDRQSRRVTKEVIGPRAQAVPVRRTGSGIFVNWLVCHRMAIEPSSRNDESDGSTDRGGYLASPSSLSSIPRPGRSGGKR